MKGSQRYSKGGGGRHVRLEEWFQKQGAWATLPPGPRALYLELKRRYNGKNNGEIFLSHRDAANALNISRNTVGPWFKELEKRGLIRKTRGHYLGPSGCGKASLWALTELATSDGRKATLDFKAWQPDKPQDAA